MANFFDQFDAPSSSGNFFDQFDEKPEAPKPEGGLIASLKQTVGQGIKGAGQAAADYLPGVTQDNALKSYGQEVIDANPTAVRSLSDVADSPWTATKEAVGNALGSMGAMVGAQALGRGVEAVAPFTGPARPIVSLLGKGIQFAGPVATAALPSYGGIREQQIQGDPMRADSPEAKARALAGAGAVGLIERSFGPEKLALSAMTKEGRAKVIESMAGKSLAGSIGKGMAKGAAVEGAEELVQNPVEQFAAYQDPTTPENLQETAFGGVMGALGGGVLGGAGGGISYAARPEQPQVDPNAGPLSRAAATAQETGAAGLAQSAQQAQAAEGDTQAAQPDSDPLAGLSARLTPEAMRAVRTAEGYGPESVNEVLRAYQIARNPELDPTIRQQATEALNGFWQGFDNRPNWTRPNPQPEQAPQPGTEVMPFGQGMDVAAPGAPSPFDPNTMEGDATEIAGTLPGAPRQLVGPEKRFLEAPDRMQAKRDADAAYEQAYQDLVKAEQLGASDAELLAYQQALQDRAAVRDDLNARLADTDARVSGSMDQQTAESRRSLLDQLDADPETVNLLPRFESMLKKQGYAQRRATPEERELIARRMDARAALVNADQEPVAPNELDAAAMGIRERQPKVRQPQPAPAEKPQRAAFPMTQTGAQRQAAERTQATGQAFEVVPHPTVKRRFAVQPSQQAQPTELNVTNGVEPAPSLASSGVTLTNEGDPTPTNALLNSGEISTQGTDNGTPSAQALAPTQERGTAQQAEVTNAAGSEQAVSDIAAARSPVGADSAVTGSAGVHADSGQGRPQGTPEGGAQEPGQGVGRTLEVRPSKLAAVAAHRALRKAYPEAQLEVTKQGDGWAVVDRTDDPFTDSPANAVEGAMGRLAQLQGMADAAGWSERGGKLLRDEGAEGEVTGRTKWLPTEAWFAGKPAGVTEQHMRSAVEKVASGRGILTKPERDGLAYMQETLRDLESQDRARQNEEASRTAELDALASEAAAELTEAEVEAIREQLAVQMESATQDDYLLALKEAFHEKAIQSRTGREAGQADARGARQGVPEGRGEGGREASAFSLESQTPQDLAARDAAQRETAEREQQEQQERERKAQADAERGSFTLTGSDRAADVQAAMGQGGLFDGQSATPNSPEPRADQGQQADTGADKIKRSFAGESARTADTHALATAQRRIAAGEDAEVVRQETGWHKAPDGKWRFEIDDSDAAILPALQSLGRGGYDAREIASVTYRKRNDGTYDLTLNPPNPKETSDFVTLTAVRPEVMRAVLPGAAAQAVERNAGAEDFIGDFEEAKRIDAAFTFDGFNALPLDQVIDHPALFAAYPALREVMVQVDPKLGIGGAFSLVEHADGTTTQVIRIGKGQQLSTLLHEIQHGIQDIEGFASGGTARQMMPENSKEILARRQEILDRITAAPDDADVSALWDQLDAMEENPAITAEDRYRRLAGETEARNTQTRQKLTAAERRATSPESTADVKASDVIVVFNGTEMASAPAPANAAPMESTGTTPDAIWSAVESLVGPLRRRRIIVVQSADVLVEQGILQSRDANGAQAFVKDGKAYFIASNIQPGNERAVFLHEVGAHLGMEKILSPFTRNVLLNRIKTWAAQANGSVESRIAQAAQRRVEAAGVTGTDADAELIAYAVEEAVKAGISPTTDTTGPIGQWFKTLWAALRTALEKLGLVNASKLTAQDVVNLAHGAANVAMGEDATGGGVQFSRAAANIAPVWDVPESSKLFNRFDTDSLLYTLQDKHVDTKRVVEAIRKQSGDIADEFNPYLQEELFHGRSAKGVKDFLDSELRPLLTEMSLRKVDMATLEKFLHARHAEERNIQIAKINPKMPDGGSGMETQEARDYLAALDPAQKALLDKLAARIDAINASTRQLLVDAGLEKPETIKAWEGAYKHYVPLQREEVDSGGLGIGQGFSVKGSASKRAMGSDKAVADIIANIAMQRERAIVRAEKNRVSQALYALALKAPNPEFWMPINPAEAQAFTPKQQQTVIDELTSMGLDPADAMNFVKEPKQRYIDPRTGLVSERINPVMRSAPNVLATRINGEDRYVFFNAGDERANRMVHALKNLDADQLGRMLQTSAKLTRWFASVNTQYNPVFGAINLTRDVQGAILNLSTTPIRGQEAKVLANTFSALKGIYTDLRAIRKGGVASSQWASLWEEFQKEGGQTGYRDMFSNATERAEAIQKELDQLGEGKLKAGGRALFDWLSDYNESMENAVRLAAYKAAKDQGISAQQAASIAKSITVNFNRKGAITTQAGALYAFFNAAVQGTTRMAQTLNGPAGRKIILGGLTLGAMQAVLLAAAGFDDEDPPEFVRERSIIIPTGGGKYISIPMPLGFHVIPSTSRILTEWALSGFKHTPKRFSDVLSLFADTFNPIGNAGWSMQTLAPTALDPLAALAENRDWSGKPIAREDFNKMTPTPGYSRAKDTASWVSKTIAYWANLATGGTDYKPGMFSPTPDQLDYLIGQFTGGVGREYLKAEQTATSVWTGEDLPPHKIPLLGRFYGDTTGQSSEANRFYSNLKEVNQHKLEIDGRRKDGGDVGEYMRDNPTARLAMVTSRFETNVRKLRQARRDAVERGDSQERIKALDAQMTTVMRQFNEQFARLDE